MPARRALQRRPWAKPMAMDGGWPRPTANQACTPTARPTDRRRRGGSPPLANAAPLDRVTQLAQALDPDHDLVAGDQGEAARRDDSGPGEQDDSGGKPVLA